SIENLADISTMSVSRFFPNFKKAMGVTAIEYLNHYRVSKAIILLMNDSDLSIENISEQVGFESAAYFRRVFKKVTGKSPREYRKTSMEL
ncbi:MAG: helix-turn-helix transcriptional regulator, partial [Lachnospiraceae bacterium]|nr:helix-turn-helix transcriptional regulator [Lachnospiraceae bacterium]